VGTNVLDHRKLYRLPWTLPDNGISWIEPTAFCNLACDGCYRESDKDSHKSWDEITRELDIFDRYRGSDCMSIAGGEPLLYPEIVRLVAEIKQRGWKPIINTNGLALTPELLRELNEAGVFGFTFHVDSNQGRGKEWAGKNELELNELRLHYAEMVAGRGNIACSFNSTVYAENLQYVPGMIEWARQHIDIVHTIVFICFRHVIPDMPYDWYLGSQKIEWDKLWYHSDRPREVTISSTDLVSLVRQTEPDFSPSAYLNGTEMPDTLKWLLTERIGTRSKTFGYVGPRFVELLSSVYHFANGKYLSYASPKAVRKGRTALALLWPFDTGVRQAAKNYLRFLLRNPFRIFRKAHLQAVMFIQPVDCMADGGQNMCDGCPDITVHENRLVWSCRLEEWKKFGGILRTVPKEQAVPTAEKESAITAAPSQEAEGASAGSAD
jgi:hypothetical protein